MRFDLLTNGTDSLKASYDNLEKIDVLAVGVEHNIKDAIMYLNHANEILFKLMLKKRNEYLIFEDISAYMRAKDAMIQQGKSTVFDINSKLRTVNFTEAIRRLELLCDIEISPKFKGALNYLNKKRNDLMHFEIEISEKDVWILIDKLKICHNLSVDFFNIHLEEDGINELFDLSRFEQTVDDYMDDMAANYAEMEYEARLEATEAANEALGQGIPGFK